jgi:hypothetical protein
MAFESQTKIMAFESHSYGLYASGSLFKTIMAFESHSCG